METMSKASEVTGFSLNTLGRMLSVYEFINKIAPTEAIEENAENYPFSSLEILKRIHSIAPSQTPPLLASIRNKEISMRELRKKLEMLQSEQPIGDNNRRSTSIRNYKEFEKLALHTIRDSLSEFHCPKNWEFVVLTNRVKSRAHDINITTPDALAFDRESIDESSTGFNIVYAGHEKVDLLANKIRHIVQCCYMSSFFSKLFLVLPANVDQNVAKDIADTFAHTRHFNIGVALLTHAPSKDGSNDNFIFLSRPLDKEAPCPDCRMIVDWNSILS
jgi:hypothetical protein